MLKLLRKPAKMIKRAHEKKVRQQEARHISDRGIYSLYEYKDQKGEFDYQKYIETQITTNKRKIECVWAQKENIDYISRYLIDNLRTIEFGLCHGTRRGLEQQWFIENLRCEVVGTEISDTASEFPNTIQWDFHKAKPEWIGAADFIYSNSLDHSYDPELCLNTWISCLKDDGILIIEHSSDDSYSKESDPFGAHLHVMPYLFLVWGKGAYSARKLEKAPVKARFNDKQHDTYFFFIKKNLS